MTFWVAGAVLVGGVVAGAGSAVAGSEQAGADKTAANTQQSMFNTIVGQEQPFMQAGYGATSQLSNLLGTSGNTGAAGYGSLDAPFTPQDYLNNQDPGYQFQLQTGGQAVRNADTPGLGALSGASLKDLMGFNQQMAATGYQNAFNRYQTQQSNVFGRLSGLAGLGQNAASNTGTAGTSLGTGIAQAQAAQGAATAGGIVGSTNALGSAANTTGLLSYLAGSQPSGSTGEENNPEYLNSDAALKACIEPYRFHGMSGLMVYDFEYKSDPGTPQRGYIAQEVQKLYPEAVRRGPHGYLMVNYAKVPGWDELDAIMKEGVFDG
jgi:hypothetical protein